MNRSLVVLLLCSLVMLLVGWCATATDAQMFFSSDKNGQQRVTNVQEGDEIWIVVLDPDENTDCDVRDKIWTDVKIMDPKTGAYIVWKSYVDETGDASGHAYDDVDYVPFKGHSPGTTAGWLGSDYLEETAADTGVFVSKRAFQIGTRESFSAAEPWKHTHVVDQVNASDTDDFRWGHYLYADFDDDGWADNRGWFGAGGSGSHPNFNLQMMLASESPHSPAPPSQASISVEQYLIGRFENMDTLVGMVQDPNDATDVAIAMMKIIDTEATISWDQAIYKDGNEAATITVIDPDENLNCNQAEAVPVFILVNPGSWNPVNANPGTGDGGTSPTNFCMLLRSGGVRTGVLGGHVGGSVSFAPVVGESIRWYNIYRSANVGHRYYIQYDPARFATTDVNGITAVLFYAWETGASTGVFQLNLNSILVELGFNSLNVRDVLAAYYLDPNDFDDFKLATAFIEERQHSITSFTDANRADRDLFWIGRDPVYVQVIDANANVDPCCPEQVVVHICDPHGEDDAEWLILDETSSNSPVFFTFADTQLWPVWDALGVGLADSIGGFQLQLDNWKIEAFNEDDILARYNDVYYSSRVAPNPVENDVSFGLSGLGDADPHTSFPPSIAQVRVANDVSFDLMSISDTQVFDGTTAQMYFLDRQGNRVSTYVNSDCVFIEVIDPDQDEDEYRRERIDAFWDGGQHIPFGPKPLNTFDCDYARAQTHPVNVLLGDTNIFNDSPDPNLVAVPCDGEPKIYVLNPRSGRWAAVDLLETGPASGDFVSVICIDLTGVYGCAPTLDVLPGDTILAFYQDPSNHSDSAMISVEVGIGGGGTPPSQQSTTAFVDADGKEVASYSDADLVYVKVTDPSHAGVAMLADAVEIDGETYGLTIWYDVMTFAPTDTFMTAALDLDLSAGDQLTATYTDPTDPTDTSSDTISIIASVLEVVEFYATPNPFDGECTFGYTGTGTASVMSVEVYDLSGTMVWAEQQANVTEIVWNGTGGAPCRAVANGAYIYVISASDGANTFIDEGKAFVKH
ncbi:hypothetical protein ACFLS0_07345 [Candidatus Bipolaricaulota bacterium]